MKERHRTGAPTPMVWQKLHLQLSAGEIRRDLAALRPLTGTEGDSVKGTFVVPQPVERAQSMPPLQESWLLPPKLGSHGHPPPAEQRRAMRWPPLAAGATAAPASSAERPHRSERALRRPSRYAGEEELEEAHAEEQEEEEQGAEGGAAAPVAAAAVGPAARSRGHPSPVATPPGRVPQPPSGQADSHARAAPPTWHEAVELAARLAAHAEAVGAAMRAQAAAAAPPTALPPAPAVSAPAPTAPGRSPLVVADFGGRIPHAYVPVQQSATWLPQQPTALLGAAAPQPAGLAPWAASRPGGEVSGGWPSGQPDVQWATATPPPPPHPTTPPAAAGGATLPVLEVSPAQHRLLGPATSILRPPQGSGQQPPHEQWLEAAAAQLPISPRHGAPAAADQLANPTASAPAATAPFAGWHDVQAARMRAMLGLGTQQ